MLFIYPNLIPNSPPSSVASVSRVGSVCLSKSKPSGMAEGTASSFIVTMYWKPKSLACPAPISRAFATWRSSTPSNRWLSWNRKPGPIPLLEQSFHLLMHKNPSYFVKRRRIHVRDYKNFHLYINPLKTPSERTLDLDICTESASTVGGDRKQR